MPRPLPPHASSPADRRGGLLARRRAGDGVRRRRGPRVDGRRRADPPERSGRGRAGLPDPWRQRQPQRHDLPPRARRWRDRFEVIARRPARPRPERPAARRRRVDPRGRPRCFAARSPRLGVERPIVVGHSYGGSVALAWARRCAGVASRASSCSPRRRRSGRAGSALTTDLLANPLTGPCRWPRRSPTLVTRGFAERTLATVFAPQAPPRRLSRPSRPDPRASSRTACARMPASSSR